MKRQNREWRGPPKLTWTERGKASVSSDGRFTLAPKSSGGWILTDAKKAGLTTAQWVRTRTAGERWAEQVLEGEALSKEPWQ